MGRSDHPSLSSHRGKLSDPHGRDQETARLESPQTGRGSDPPAFLAPILTLLTTSRGKIHRKNVLTSRRPYSPTGLANCNLQQGSNKGGASLGIIVLNYLSTKLGSFTRPWGLGSKDKHTIPEFLRRRGSLLANPGLPCVNFRDKLSCPDTCREIMGSGAPPS